MHRENEEFKALFDASGWSQAEAGRRLHKDRASISRYLSGQIAPEPVVLELFKMILSVEKPDVLSVANRMTIGTSGEADQLLLKLEELRTADPDAYEQAKNNIEFLHDRISEKPPTLREQPVTYIKKEPEPSPKTEVDRVAEELGKKAADDVSQNKVNQVARKIVRRGSDNVRKGRQ